MGFMKVKSHADANLQVQTMPRIRALYYYVYELAQSFHGDDALESIRKGVLENQILEVISFEYLNKNKDKVAEISIEIDWDKHLLLAKTAESEYIKIDMEKSVADNIVSWRRYVVAHLDEVMRQFDVDKIKCSFRYRSKFTANDAIYNDTMKIMNHKIAELRPSVTNIKLQEELESTLKKVTSGIENSGEYKKREFSGDKLEEVTVSMKYKVKK